MQCNLQCVLSDSTHIGLTYILWTHSKHCFSHTRFYSTLNLGKKKKTKNPKVGSIRQTFRHHHTVMFRYVLLSGTLRSVRAETGGSALTSHIAGQRWLVSGCSGNKPGSPGCWRCWVVPIQDNPTTVNGLICWFCDPPFTHKIKSEASI